VSWPPSTTWTSSPRRGQQRRARHCREGSFVRKGDIVVTIDSTNLQDKIETATLDLQRAQSDLTAAKESKEIQESTNVANLEAARSRCSWPSSICSSTPRATTHPAQKAQTAVEMAQILIKNKEDELAQTRALFAKASSPRRDQEAELDLLQSRSISTRRSATSLFSRNTPTRRS